jgi:hypothetical protein
MANEVRITIGADTKQADKAVKSFRDRLDSVSKKAKIAGTALSVMGVGGVVAIKGFAEAALVQKQAMDGLAAVMATAGQSFDEMEDKIMSTTAALQRKTNYGDEAQLRVLTNLVPVLGDTNLALDALPAIMDVAATTGKDFEAVARLLGPVLAGATHNLADLGIKFEESQGPAERMAQILDAVGGAAEATADPFTQMDNAMGDLKESIGMQLLPLITPLIKHLQSFAESLQNVNPHVLKIGALILAGATALGLIGGPILLLIGMLPLLAAGFTAVTAAALPITLVIVGIAAAVTAGILIWRNWATIMDFMGNRLDHMKKRLMPLIDGIKSLIDIVKQLIKVIAESPIGTFIGGVGGVVSGIGGAFGKLGKFASGGRVPGPEGSPQLAVVHGGEMILNRQQQARTGVTINITGNNITGEIELDRLVRRAITSAGVRGAI